jgi:hypothetical protein
VPSSAAGARTDVGATTGTVSTPPPVTVHVASLNTAASTELCIRSMRTYAGHPFDLVIGDCGSTDGSLEMLQQFEEQGWLRLEVAPEGRGHSEWLDLWLHRDGADRCLAVFVDSDVEFLSHGWLSELVTVALTSNAALVCAEMVPEMRRAVDPVGHRLYRGAPRPSSWLLLVDRAQVAGLPVSFAFHAEETASVPEGLALYDVGGRLHQDLCARDLRCISMPRPFRRRYRHYGGLSWVPLDGRRGRRKARDLATVERHLTRMRALDVSGPPGRGLRPRLGFGGD